MTNSPSKDEMAQLERLYSQYEGVLKIKYAWEADPVYSSDSHDKAVMECEEAEKALDDFRKILKSRYPAYDFKL
ncbi:MAG: hypothetical protein Q8N82_07170 [Deltaproteobacteria bacterium]|nr:hypothetical protein [Deltaproteobacteria bacterium]